VLETEDAGRAVATRPASVNQPRATARAEIRVSCDGRPAGGATIELLHVAREGEVEREELRLHAADEQGRLALELEPGTLRAVAWTADATALPVGETLVAGGLAELELALVPAWPVAGRVLDAASGRPLADAEVSFWTFAERDVVRTAADGTFRHPRFPAGAPAQQVRATAAGHGALVRYLRIGADGSWRLPSAVAGGEAASGSGEPWLELALEPELVVRGRVLDAAGAPLAGARVSAEGFVQVLPSVAARDAGAAVSGADGAFELAGLRADVGHALAIEAPGHAQRALELAGGIGLERGALDLGDVALAPESALAGVVVDADGIPVADVEVVLTARAVEAPPSAGALDVPVRVASRERRTRTSAAGTFLFTGLEPRPVHLSVQGERGVLAEQELQPRADGSFPDPCLALGASWARELALAER